MSLFGSSIPTIGSALKTGYGDTNTPLAYRVLCFSAMVITTGIIQAFFDRITADTGLTRYFVGDFGIALGPIQARSGMVLLAPDG